MSIIISDKYMNQIDNLYRAKNMSDLTELSTKLLNKYRNNRSKIVMIMNRYKKRRDLIKKRMDIHKVYTYTPNNVNKLVNAGNITSKKNQSVENYIRGKASFKNEKIKNLGFINKRFVAKRPFTIFGRRVKGFIPVPPSLDLEEAHAYAKFMQRSMSGIRIGKSGKSKFESEDDIKIKFTVVTADQGGAIFF